MIVSPALITAALPAAQLKIDFAGRYNPKIAAAPPHANVQTGNRLSVGLVASTYQNGYISGSAWDWGVSQFRIYPNSTLSIKSFGQAIAGGRVLELAVRGKAQVDVRYLTQSSSQVKACFGGGRGCIILRSSATIKELPDGRYSVGLIEGRGVVQDYLEQTRPVTLLPGWFSIMATDGSFAPAKMINKKTAYRVLTQTKVTQLIQADDGYEIVADAYSGNKLQLPKNASFQIKSPLD